MYYENFEKLCILSNIKPNKVSKETGISTATLTSWKQGKYTPKQDKLQLIADYFKVSVDYLMTGKESEFTIEMAKTDVALSNMPDRMKKYALLMADLPLDKQEHVIQLINILNEKE